MYSAFPSGERWIVSAFGGAIADEEILFAVSALVAGDSKKPPLVAKGKVYSLGYAEPLEERQAVLLCDGGDKKNRKAISLGEPFNVNPLSLLPSQDTCNASLYGEWLCHSPNGFGLCPKTIPLCFKGSLI